MYYKNAIIVIKNNKVIIDSDCIIIVIKVKILYNTLNNEILKYFKITQLFKRIKINFKKTRIIITRIFLIPKEMLCSILQKRIKHISPQGSNNINYCPLIEMNLLVF